MLIVGRQERSYTRVQVESYRPGDNNLSKMRKYCNAPTRTYSLYKRKESLLPMGEKNNSSDFKLMCTTPYLCFMFFFVRSSFPDV